MTPSSLVLIAVNLLPIGGVLLFDWSVLELLLLYWTESVVIGVVNVLRMLSSQSTHPLAGMLANRMRMPAAAKEAMEMGAAGKARHSMKLFLIPFFTVHYGAFCFGHLGAVVGIFSGDQLTGPFSDAIPAFTDYVFWLVVGFIFLSHLFSFLTNFIGKGEYQRTGVATLMQRPYGRIMVMHVTVIFGAFLIDWLDNPLPMLLVLVVAKTAVDLKFHSRERERFGAHVLTS